MRICFVAYFNEEDGKGDMGTRTVARHLAEEVSKKHEVLKVDIRDIGLWKRARAFKPDIIHFVFAPTTMGFIAAKIFSLYCRDARIVMSAPNPTLSCRRLVKYLKPDVILVQSQESEEFFRDLGFMTRFLPNGVNVDRFVPAIPGQKEQFREKYQIDREKFIILHVGPVIRKRNIDQLIELNADDAQVVIIGRTPFDSLLLARLQVNGAVVITDYIERIEEVYALSDCYVFPTDPQNRGTGIEIPLSVLEAMACNLPVVSTKYGALPRLFSGIENSFVRKIGITFNNVNGLKKNVERYKTGSIETKNREIVQSFSWEKIGLILDQIYFEK